MAGIDVLSISVHGLWHAGRTQNLVANPIDSPLLVRSGFGWCSRPKWDYDLKKFANELAFCFALLATKT